MTTTTASFKNPIQQPQARPSATKSNQTAFVPKISLDEAVLMFSVDDKDREAGVLEGLEALSLPMGASLSVNRMLDSLLDKNALMRDDDGRFHVSPEGRASITELGKRMGKLQAMMAISGFRV